MTNFNTLPLSILSRPARNESPSARMIRLAAKAVAEGCRVVILPGSGRWVTKVGVTSGSTTGLIYVVDLEARGCTCKAGRGCKHVALVMSQLSLLPDVAA